MDGKQLYAGGEPFFPESAAEKIKALDIYGLTGTKESNAQLLINVIAQMVANTLLAKTDIAEWAKEVNKPVYTAEEVGADARGSAATALEDAKGYADRTYAQATGYADRKVAELINGAPSTLDTIGEIAAAMLEHEEVVEALEAAIGNKASEVEYQAHERNSAVHVTASKQAKWDEYEERIEEVFLSVSNGIGLVASAITDRGVATAADAEFQVLADNIGRIARPSGNAGAAQVLSPYTFSNVSGVGIVGTMPNRGAVTAALNAGGSYTIPAGYHNGSGKITANSLAGQTNGTATAAHVLAGMIAWVKGVKITGSMANRGAVTAALNAGGSYTIPAGYHNGTGKVTGNSLASQTTGTATAANITAGKTGWVHGVKVTGTGADNTAQYNAGVAAGKAAAGITGNAKIVTRSSWSEIGEQLGVIHYTQIFKTGITGRQLWKTIFLYAYDVVSNGGGTAYPFGYVSGGGVPSARITYNASSGDVTIVSASCQTLKIVVIS